MQGFPYAAGPMSAGGTPVDGIPTVQAPYRPPGVVPSLTQQPTAPPTGWPWPNQPTYQGMPGPGFQPPLMRVPGPATLGPTPEAAYGAPGGVPGVSLAPVSGICPPAATGGPHPLPNLPPMPLPQGFPNPFAMSPMGPGCAPGAPGYPPGAGAPAGGSSYVTGPQGYLPGLGYFGPAPTGQPGMQPPMQQGMPAFPPMQPMQPMQQPMQPMQQPMQPMQQPGMPMQPGPGQGPQGGMNQFWLHMGWQLLQTPPVKEALGAQFAPLMEGANRGRLLQLAATTLTGQEMQTAFRNLSQRAMNQEQFVALFAAALKAALRSAGMLSA